MKNHTLFALWGGMFILCACLGFIPSPAGAVKWLLVALSVGCFVPPLMLVQQGDRKTLALIRNLSLASLILTVALILVNFLTVAASETVGNLLHYILIIVSSPMACGQYWILSLFLWAYLMIASITALKKK